MADEFVPKYIGGVYHRGVKGSVAIGDSVNLPGYVTIQLLVDPPLRGIDKVAYQTDIKCPPGLFEED